MLPTLVFPRLTALALVAGLGLSQTPIAQAADAPASSESGASASIRPTLDKPTFFKRKEVAKEAPKPQAAKPAAKPTKDKGGKEEADDEPLERLEYASKKDHQFQQALNLLKGLKIMQNKAQ